jgi:Protein of unknown function (DUF2585)
MSEFAGKLFTRRTLLAAISLVVVFGVVLYLQDRPPWCEQGFGLWTSAWSGCTSQHLLDPYTLSHVLHGIIFYWILWPFASRFSLPQRTLAAVVLEIGWEAVENSQWVIERYRQQTAALGYVGDSIVNSLADVLATIVGFAFASRFSWKASVAVFVVFELWMLYVARDNLTLNVLMLFFPIEAIKQWQLAV